VINEGEISVLLCGSIAWACQW